VFLAGEEYQMQVLIYCRKYRIQTLWVQNSLNNALFALIFKFHPENHRKPYGFWILFGRFGPNIDRDSDLLRDLVNALSPSLKISH